MSWSLTGIACAAAVACTALTVSAETAFDSAKGKLERIEFGGYWAVRTQFDSETDETGAKTDVADWSGEGSLVVRVYAAENAFANVLLDGSAGTGDDLLEEVYFKWSKMGEKPFGMPFGKHEVAFGLDKGLYETAIIDNDAAATYVKETYGNMGVGLSVFLAPTRTSTWST